MVESGTGKGGTSEPRVGESLSQLVARILDQLSLSAWLPSAALVLLTIFAVETRREHGSPASAAAAMSEARFAEILLVLGLIVVSTVFTQAFEFEAIRLLEGYWGTSRVAAKLAGVKISRHVKRRERLRRRHKELDKAARRSAQPALKKYQSKQVARIILKRLEHQDVNDGSPEERKIEQDFRERARRIPWRHYAEPTLMRQLEEVADQLSHIPVWNNRVLPTKIGNTLRAAEDLYIPSGENVEGYILKHFDELPAAVRHEHDQYRTRLDLYCALTFVAVIGGFGTAALWWTFGWLHTVVAFASGISIAGVMLRAARATAEGYAVTLEEIARRVALSVS